VFTTKSRGWRVGSSFFTAVMFLIFGNGCAATESGEKEETVVIRTVHPHSAEVLSVSVVGRVPDNGKKIGVTAKFSENKPTLERLSIVDPDGNTIVVPRSYYEKVRLPQENSLSLGYLMDGRSNTVAEIQVFLDFGDRRNRADLHCENNIDTGDPAYETFALFYDVRARKFETDFKDYCYESVAK
jgi:hypothetical protein